MARKSSGGITISGGAILTILAIVVVLAVYFIGPSNLLQKLGAVSGGEKVISADVQGSIQALSELNTAEYVYTITETMDTESVRLWGLNIPGTNSRVIFSYDGIIKAGIDFSQVEVTMDESMGIIEVYLPEAEITGNELLLDSLQVYEEKTGVFKKTSFEDVNTAQKKAKEKALDKAMENGLTEKAYENAKEYLRAFIKGLPGMEEYEICFAE